MKKNKMLIVLIALAVLVLVYFSGVFYYKDKFLSKVYVNEVNVGGMNLEAAGKKLKEEDAWDKVTITSDTEDFLEVKAGDIEYKYVDTPDLPKIFNEQNEWKWFTSVFKNSTYTRPVLSTYNKDKLHNMIDGIEELDKQLSDAKVVYSDSSKGFLIEPHSYEIKLSEEELSSLVGEAIEKRDQKVNIEKYIEEPSIFEDDESLIEAKKEANQYLDIELKYDFEDREELVDASVVKDFVSIKGTDVDIDPEEVKEYVAALSKKYDTYGRAREFTTSRGETISTSGGTYGWMTHRGKTADELIQYIKDGEDKTIEPVYSYKASIRKSDDIGDSYVEIDLSQQMVYVYTDGELRVKTQTVTGDASKGYNTPPGVYPVNYKETDAVLRGEGYASPVKYWVPFNGHIGLHDADWRDNFGGDIYKNNGSHGCINLPPSNAKTMFDSVYPGMPVIVH